MQPRPSGSVVSTRCSAHYRRWSYAGVAEQTLNHCPLANTLVVCMLFVMTAPVPLPRPEERTHLILLHLQEPSMMDDLLTMLSANSCSSSAASAASLTLEANGNAARAQVGHFLPDVLLKWHWKTIEMVQSRRCHRLPFACGLRSLICCFLCTKPSDSTSI